MKFSSIFASCLAALSLGVAASPVPNEDYSNELEARIPDLLEARTPDLLEARARKIDPAANYNAIAKVHPDLEVGKYYVFTVTTDLVPKDDKESQTEINQLRQKLGFDHIYIVLGQVKERMTGPPKKQTPVKEFHATISHMVKEKATNDSPVEVKSSNWGYDDTQGLNFIKQTNKKNYEAFSKKAKQYKDDHKTYNVDTNNCNTYVTWAEGQL